MTKTTVETMSHRTAGAPPPCLECHHNRRRSTAPLHAARWPQDNDDSHIRAYSTRRHSLQAKLARPSLRLTTIRSGEPPPLYVSWPRTLYKSSQGILSRYSASPTHSLTLHRSRAPEASFWATCLLALALLPLPPFLHPHCKNLEHSSEEHALDHL